MKTAAIWFLSLVLLALSGPLSASQKQIGDPRGFEQTLAKATFALYGSDADQTRFLCSATIFQKTSTGYELLSAGHCVGEMPSEVTFFIAEQVGSKLMPVTNLKARRDGNQDFSIWDFKTKNSYPVIPLGDERREKLGNRTLNVNFSGGLGKQLSPGVIASFGLVRSHDCEECDGKVFIVQEFAAPGASGSAIVSQKTHKIIGILVVEWQDAQVGFGIDPISLFPEFLAAADQYADLHKVQDDEDDEDQ